VRRLTDLGIEVHAQAVLVPGRNDGPHLDHTIEDLAALYPGVSSLCVVPVGLTRWHTPEVRPYTDAEAAATLAQVRSGRRGCAKNSDWVLCIPPMSCYAAGQPVPPIEAYDTLLPALIENGVGMLRLFLDTWLLQQETLAEQSARGRVGSRGRSSHRS
jgi:NifB/MoaA-like Fe-S oxidoreductase